jgi:hypothetical protein
VQFFGALCVLQQDHILTLSVVLDSQRKLCWTHERTSLSLVILNFNIITNFPPLEISERREFHAANLKIDTFYVIMKIAKES